MEEPSLVLNSSPEGSSPAVGTGKNPISSPEVSPDKRRFWGEMRQRIDANKVYKRKLIQNWTISIDYRRGKPFSSQTDEDRVAVNLDWALTKAKQAALFSQVPQVRVDHPPQSVDAGEWLYKFEQRLNDTLVIAGIESAMDECLPDCINAAGFGAAIVAFESITEDVVLPATDPSMAPPVPGAPQLPPKTIKRPTDRRYIVDRISPADLLWPINFIGSDFDKAPWIGRSGRITWAQAVQRFGLTDKDRETIMGEERATLDRLTHDIDKDKTVADEMVAFDEIFYKSFEYDPATKKYGLINHIIFLQGKTDPVMDEPWEGQKFDGKNILGPTRFPIRVFTLAYITDETIPPSDSAIGRPQVNEINKSRTQMILQRERSMPVRWVDVNRVDSTIAQNLMRGTWNAFIPVQGQGQNAIGEVARAVMPSENFTFDRIAKADLTEAWSLGSNQEGSGSNIETKGEADIVQQDYQTKIGRERARVAKFFCTIAEVLGGLLCLYEDPGSFGPGFDPSVSKALTYSILADSTVLVDSQQRLQRLVQFLNFTAKSGWINIGPVIKEIATLSGLDPNVVVQPPQPKPPAEPNISLRLTGTADLMNPLALATLINSGQAPNAQQIQAAMQLIQSAVTPPPGGWPNGFNPQFPGAQPNLTVEQLKGNVPPTPGGAPTPPTPPPAGPPPGPGGPANPPPPPPVGSAEPQWAGMTKLNKRTEEGQS